MDDSLIKAAHVATEQAQQNSPASYPWVTYAWVIGLSAWGGAVSFCQKMKDGVPLWENTVGWFKECFISGFAGLLTFFLCEASHVPPLITAVFVGISGHMGSRAIFLIERWAINKWGRV